MRVTIAFAATTALAATLAACGKPAPAPEAAATETMAAATPSAMATLTPGTYDATYKDGRVARVVVGADGAYTATMGKELPEAGVVKMVGGKTCFDPSGDGAGMCWTDSAMAADGSGFTSTSDKGEVVTVKVVKP